ncbi:hypothetical protein CFP56_008280 [Quercus suber]|uniref:Uncharacterized protein n=1 Tax=Quercus suber TaxID=58331 RepID=A0AAW0L5W5_QUESU
MASFFCRSALKVGSTSRSSLASCSKTLNPKSLIPKSNIPSTPASAFSSSSTIPRASRTCNTVVTGACWILWENKARIYFIISL